MSFQPLTSLVSLLKRVGNFAYITERSRQKHDKNVWEWSHFLGCRNGLSSETQLLETLDDITKRAANNKQIDIILLDFSEAFDKVPHKRLLNKLNYYGIHSNTLCDQWIYSFLHDRKQLVLLEGVKSSTATVDSGVPQGSLGSTIIPDLHKRLTRKPTLFSQALCRRLFTV